MRSCIASIASSCLVFLALACGTQNSADPYTTKTKDEQARAALDANDYEQAVRLYQELVEAEPENYERYPLLASALAGRAGLDLVSLAKSQINSSGNALDQVSSFLPADDSTDFMTLMGQAVSLLKSMPEDHRSVSSSYSYAPSANFQLAVYSLTMAAMTVRRFVNAAQNGYDPEKLASMTADEATAFISSLEGAIESVKGGGIGQTLGQSADQLRETINNTPGDTMKDKLSHYLANNGKQQQPSP